jgi:hypothetical protein
MRSTLNGSQAELLIDTPIQLKSSQKTPLLAGEATVPLLHVVEQAFTQSTEPLFG